MMVGEWSTVIGQSKRYATDGASLTEAVANGETFIDMMINVPKTNTGGILMVTVEAVPQPMFERQRNPFLHAQTVEDFPHFLRDTLDPEPVEIVKNADIDVRHATPNGSFGYRPLNAGWNMRNVRIGGKYFRPDVDGGFVEDRNALWASEVANPTLSADWHLATQLHKKPFAFANQDVFNIVIQGDFLIEGNTVFGPLLVEGSSEDYAKVMDEAPVARIVKP